MIRHLAPCLLSLLAIGGACAVHAAAGAAAKPNLVFILADDLGWADPEYQGAKTCRLHETPNMDRLAAEGMNFERFYPGAANCAPARACLLTGMYMPRHHVYLAGGWTGERVEETKMRWKVPKFGADESFNSFQVNVNHVDPKWVSLAEMLKPGGYITARIGKWHIGEDLQGFDVVSADGTPGNHSNKSYYRDNDVTDRMTDAAIDFLTQNRDRPFFLYLAHWEPHGPLLAREDRIAYYRKKFAALGNTECNPIYAAMVEQVDISTGRIMEALGRLGLERNTLVVFSSDNGGGIDLHGTPSNYPLKAYKGTYYEGGIRTPCIVRWPAVVKPGTRTDYPVNGVDLMPTFAAVAGVPIPATQPVDGVSILPLLEGRTLPERATFFHFPLYLGGTPLPVTWGDRRARWRAVPLTTVMRGDWKLIHYYEYDRQELFNLREDPGEHHDLSASHPEQARKLLAELRAWTKAVNAPIPSVRNERFEP